MQISKLVYSSYIFGFMLHWALEFYEMLFGEKKFFCCFGPYSQFHWNSLFSLCMKLTRQKLLMYHLH